MSTRRVVVDGETWQVSDRGDGHHDFSWLTGKAAGYGFTRRLCDPAAGLTTAQVEEAIREFMRNVNSETGYLD